MNNIHARASPFYSLASVGMGIAEGRMTALRAICVPMERGRQNCRSDGEMWNDWSMTREKKFAPGYSPREYSQRGGSGARQTFVKPT